MRSPYPPSDDFSSSGGVRSTRAVPARSSAAPAASVTTIDPTIRAEAAIPAKKRTRIELCMALYPPGGGERKATRTEIGFSQCARFGRRPPEGRQQESPGQRPGNRIRKMVVALKGRNRER